MELLIAMVMACCFTARVAVGSDPDVIGVFTLCVNVGSDLRITLGKWIVGCSD